MVNPESKNYKETDQETIEFRKEPVIFTKEKDPEYPFFPRSIKPIKEDLKIGNKLNLTEQEYRGYLDIQNKRKQLEERKIEIETKLQLLEIIPELENEIKSLEKEKFDTKTLKKEIENKKTEKNNLLTELEVLKPQMKKVAIIINPNNKYSSDENTITNPQQLIIIDEENNRITRFPVSLGKAGSSKEVSDGKTQTGMFSVLNTFSVTDKLDGKSSGETSFYNATHHRWETGYKLNEDPAKYIQGASMVYKFIAIDKMSLSRGIFIHGTNSREKIGMPESNGCIRILVEHIDEVISYIENSAIVKKNKSGYKEIIQPSINGKKTLAENGNNMPGGTIINIIDME